MTASNRFAKNPLLRGLVVAAAAARLASSQGLPPAPVLPGQGQSQPAPARNGRAGQDPNQQLQPMLLPQAVVLPRGEREIAIDGSLIDWPRLPAMRLDDRRQLSGTATGAYRGPADCSGLVFMMWDSDSLYVACSARDEWHRELDAKTLQLIEIPAADSLLLTFDPDRNTRSNGADPGRREDREFWLADEQGHEVVQWDRMRGSARLVPEPGRMVVLHQKESGVTTYEARIPWREILPVGREAKVGTCIDLQMILNDFDETTDAMPQTRLGWTFGIGPVVDPGILGTIMLVGDDAALRGVIPEFPPKPGLETPPVEPDEFWRGLTADLLKRPPEVYDGSVTPAEVGGVERLSVLERIDAQVGRFPRVDLLELHQRIHRRMRREVIGLCGRGLPRWWRERMHAVSKQGEDAVPAGAMRLFRLPMGGWMVRTAKDNLLIDPSGPSVREWLWGAAQIAVLTQPLNLARRNDQLLLGMFTADPVRPVFTHIAFHVPVVAMDKMPVAPLGESYGGGIGLTVTTLGTASAEGNVPFDCSYRFEIDGCPTLVVVGPTLTLDDVPEKVGNVDVLIASSRNVAMVELCKRFEPRVVLFDDAFRCQSHPTTPRVTLGHLHALQRALLPFHSVVLAPGESWQVACEPR